MEESGTMNLELARHTPYHWGHLNVCSKKKEEEGVWGQEVPWNRIRYELITRTKDRLALHISVLYVWSSSWWNNSKHLVSMTLPVCLWLSWLLLEQWVSSIMCTTSNSCYSANHLQSLTVDLRSLRNACSKRASMWSFMTLFTVIDLLWICVCVCGGGWLERKWGVRVGRNRWFGCWVLGSWA